MLVQFMLKNVLSFKKETVFDMSAIYAYKEHPYNLIKLTDKEQFLRVAAIYGANASGKSNLCESIILFKNIVRESFNISDGDSINAISKYYLPFAFNKARDNSEFQIIIIEGEFEYKYGFEYNNNCIVSEWMYLININNKRQRTIFERSGDNIKLGNSVSKECELYKNQIPKETLVLTFYNRLKLKDSLFSDFFSLIMDITVLNSSIYDDYKMLERYLPIVIDNEKIKLVEFLSAIDTGIRDVGYRVNEQNIRFYTTHRGEDSNDYYLDLYLESQGTIRSILNYIFARVTILNNRIMIVDELNVKLHPLLLKFIIDLFYDKESKAQLIYTTHDVTLLDKKFFRRDQIYFVQKDEFGHSELNSLSDYKIRSDASFEKDYLSGVYGGIPFIDKFSIRESE